jgi:hypothetical protein
MTNTSDTSNKQMSTYNRELSVTLVMANMCSDNCLWGKYAYMAPLIYDNKISFYPIIN